MTSAPDCLDVPDEADLRYVAEVRELCRLAGHPDMAVSLIESAVPLEWVEAFAIEISLGYKSPFRKGLAAAPFKDLFCGNGGFAGSDL